VDLPHVHHRCREGRRFPLSSRDAAGVAGKGRSSIVAPVWLLWLKVPEGRFLKAEDAGGRLVIIASGTEMEVGRGGLWGGGAGVGLWGRGGLEGGGGWSHGKEGSPAAVGFTGGFGSGGGGGGRATGTLGEWAPGRGRISYKLRGMRPGGACL
jgi:hypothetical protein